MMDFSRPVLLCVVCTQHPPTRTILEPSFAKVPSRGGNILVAGLVWSCLRSEEEKCVGIQRQRKRCQVNEDNVYICNRYIDILWLA